MNSEHISINEAVGRVIGLIRKYYAECEDAVARLPWTDDEALNENIREFVAGCRRLATATGQWSYLVTRYFDQSQLNKNWEMEFTL